MGTHLDNLDFDYLRQEFPAPSSCTTFAYWIGTLTEINSKIASDADEACAAMSHQYDVEEQGNLFGFPEYVPEIFRPIAPVTLTKKWSPLPLAVKLLGEPLLINSAKYGKRTLVFNRSTPQRSREYEPDIAHFLFLLDHVGKSRVSANFIMICGSPGWSYDYTDPLSRGVRKQMRDFGFVYQQRKPERNIVSRFLKILQN